MQKLLCISGIDIGQEFKISDGVVTIGRGSNNDIVLIDAEASRNHCELNISGDKIVLNDLGSTNGFTVNNRIRPQDVVLQNGDKVKIGNTILQFYTQPDENDYFLTSTKAKMAKHKLIDEEFRQFTTMKIEQHDTAKTSRAKLDEVTQNS